MSVLSRFLSRMSLWFSAFGLVMMTAIIGWQVVARYLLANAPAWAEQAALFLMLWFILFAAAAGVREGFHIRLSILQDSLAEGRRQLMAIACHAIVGAFGIAMAYGGAQLVVETWEHTIPTLGLPRGLSYVPLAVAGVIIAFFAGEHILAERKGSKVEPLWS
ncbi:TRAP transporter small permease [Aurantiacibacter gangjinensis]|uniref:TRAP transporter small permease protein n=1 Tax=Aurantiacibacter gangjinensis TaxID=502682 RepID=A0A0G9MRK0_9SPHN|nr:TRAP transporter small permease [Aurantiacibacter gangjinensis]APE26894.1 TRAP-type C4-dicarboxylate transport system, small permease component [Aurantiacibacter gangjinensis]KLE33357.1 C4-dicarboxylate ABC transporter substrate-binding protein [Aurantiacibacter gangjinensis]